MFYPAVRWCRWGEIGRENVDDGFSVRSSSEGEFSDHSVVDVDFVRVVCYGPLFRESVVDTLRRWATGRHAYTNFHAFIQLKDKVEDRCKGAPAMLTPQSGLPKINVILLGIDSVSRLMMLRQMPKTHSYLVHNLSAVEFKGHNKVADNTFPNIFAILTGKLPRESVYTDDPEAKFAFDSHPFIWKQFAQSGYRTMFVEDDAISATFNFNNRIGFKQPPTDYYWRPISLAYQEHFGARNIDRTECIGRRFEIDLILSWLRNYQERFSSDHHFSLLFLSRLTHGDNGRRGATLDDVLLDFFTDNQRQSRFHNTFLVFFSDHGRRWGSLLKTKIGKFEERTPFMYVVPPSAMSRVMTDNLRHNSRQLTSPFDVHETLRHLLLGERYDVVGSSGSRGRGASLLLPLPNDRTCDSAGIEPHWCVCNEYTTANDSKMVSQVSQFVVSRINKWLSPSQRTGQCAVLVLDQILEAEIGAVGSSRTVRDMRVTIVTSPGGGQFVATVRLGGDLGSDLGGDLGSDLGSDLGGDIGGRTRGMVLSNEISRINTYGQQSKCVQNQEAERLAGRDIRQYCVCI